MAADLRQWQKKDFVKGWTNGKAGADLDLLSPTLLPTPSILFSKDAPQPSRTDGEGVGDRQECSAHKPLPTSDIQNVGMGRMIF